MLSSLRMFIGSPCDLAGTQSIRNLFFGGGCTLVFQFSLLTQTVISRTTKLLKNPEVSECDLKFRSRDPRKRGSSPQCGPWPLWMIGSVSITSGSPSTPAGAGLCFHHLDGPHTKVMMATSIKKPFNSDFLSLAYPSSEKACHSNEPASQKWIGAGRRERRGRATGRRASQKLSLWEEVPGAGRRGAPGWPPLDWDAEPLVPSALPLRPSGLAKGADRPGSSFCPLCSPASKRGPSSAGGKTLRICQLRSQRCLPGSERRLTNVAAQGERETQEGEGGNPRASVSTLTPDTQGSARFLSQQQEQLVSGGGRCGVPAEGSTLKWPAAL